MANFLTTIRIICGLLIIPSPTFSKWYYLLYLIGGITDAIDGTVARKLGTETSFGAKYDTAADFIFTTIVVAKIASSVRFPLWLLIWIFLIFAIKVSDLLIGFIRHRRFITVHSGINKVCGAVIFILPLFIGSRFAFRSKTIVTIFACILASAAAVHESIKILKGEAVE